jgi:hypothetical protein
MLFNAETSYLKRPKKINAILGGVAEILDERLIASIRRK